MRRNIMLPISILVVLLMATYTSFAVDIVFDRSRIDSRIVLYHDVVISESPVTIKETRPGWHRVTGGDNITDTFALQCSSVDADADCEVAWLKSDTIIKLTEIEELHRLKVYDAFMHDEKLWVVYSHRANVQVDIIENRENTWRTIRTSHLFKQVQSDFSSRLVHRAQVGVLKEELYVELQLVEGVDHSEVWKLTTEGCIQIHETATIETLRSLNDRRIVEGVSYIEPGRAYSLADLNDCYDEVAQKMVFWIEAVHPSPTIGADTVQLSVSSPGVNGGEIICGTDTVRVTSVELEMHDLRLWGPKMNEDGTPGLVNNNLDAHVGTSTVGGAITDGTSICLLRITPQVDLGAIGYNPLITITKKGGTPLGSIASGTLHTVLTGQASLPALPSVGSPSIAVASFFSGKVFYVPPVDYLAPLHAPGANKLNNLETCAMEFRIIADVPFENPVTIGVQPFLLRRPPLVLVHGILSSPNTWDPSLWNEAPGAPVPTRLYSATWASTSTLGYSENWNLLAKLIEDALVEYRTANDNGHHSLRSFRGVRYAATRADVVAHSQGGQLLRFYIAGGMPPLFDRSGWTIDHSNNRDPDSPTGRWPYLRDSNFGAGSIRRFITLGSPFKGSPWADSVHPFFADGDAGPNPAVPASDLHGFLLEALSAGLVPQPWQNILWTSGTYNPPTCVADLKQGSSAQIALESAVYPAGIKRICWYPLVGIATEAVGDAPVQSALWELLSVLIPIVGGFPGEISALSPTNSDLIVPACSQRNLPTGCGDPSDPLAPGQIFPYTAHSTVGSLLVGETEKIEMQMKVGELLSTFDTHFNPTWTIGP